MFFFEKKNQKTLAPGFRAGWAVMRPVATASEQKFFGSFFQKRTCFLFHRRTRLASR
jgi:hypothetical protein